MSSKPSKIFETVDGIFYASIPSGFEKKVVREHALSEHSFQASMGVLSYNAERFYLKDLTTNGFYLMDGSSFADMVKKATLIKGMITARWKWKATPSSVTLVFCEQVDE